MPARTPMARRSTAQQKQRVSERARRSHADHGAYDARARAAMSLTSTTRRRSASGSCVSSAQGASSSSAKLSRMASEIAAHTARACSGRLRLRRTPLCRQSPHSSRHRRSHAASSRAAAFQIGHRSDGVVGRGAQRIRRLVRRQQALDAAQRCRREARAVGVAAAARSRHHSQQLRGSRLHREHPAR